MTPRDPHMLSEEEFYETYKPIKNPRNNEDEWEYEELIRAGIPGERVWTVVTGDNNSWSAIPGFFIVNRMHYIACEEPWSMEQLWVELVEEHEVCEWCYEHYEMGGTHTCATTTTTPT